MFVFIVDLLITVTHCVFDTDQRAKEISFKQVAFYELHMFANFV